MKTKLWYLKTLGMFSHIRNAEVSRIEEKTSSMREIRLGKTLYKTPALEIASGYDMMYIIEKRVKKAYIFIHKSGLIEPHFLSTSLHIHAGR